MVLPEGPSDMASQQRLRRNTKFVQSVLQRQEAARMTKAESETAERQSVACAGPKKIRKQKCNIKHKN